MCSTLDYFLEVNSLAWGSQYSLSLYKFILKKSSTWFRLVSDALENLLRGYIFYNSFLAGIGKFDIVVHLNIVCLTDTDKSDIWISVVVLTGAGNQV